jgi:hypothetical protein
MGATRVERAHAILDSAIWPKDPIFRDWPKFRR